MNPQNTSNSEHPLEKENRRLRRAVEELSILNDISAAISSTLSLDQIIDLIVQKCVKHLHVEQAAIMMLDDPDIEKPFQTMVRRADTTAEILPFRLNTQLTGWMLKNKSPLLVNDFGDDKRFKDFVEEDFPIQSLLSVPLLAKGRMIGIINLFNKKSKEGFTGEEQRLLAIIAAQSAQVLENARLLEEEKQLIRMREEMRTAREIQLNLLPKKSPQIAGYDIAGKSIPAKEVGGDYFDFIHIDENRLAFCLGDVTGKGLPAAMLMANTQATIRSQALMITSAKDCVANANKLLFHSTGMGKFVTFFYGILDLQKHTLTYCNAGHDAPFFCKSDKQIDRLSSGGVVLGFVPDYTYSEETIEFQPGSRLIIYSDGISEAMNDADEELGEELLQALISQNRRLSAEDLVGEIIHAVEKHAGETPQSDDITLVVISRQ